MTAVIDRSCTVGRPRKVLVVAYTVHKPSEKKLTPFDVAKKVGSIFAVKVASDRIYNGRVN